MALRAITTALFCSLLAAGCGGVGTGATQARSGAPTGLRVTYRDYPSLRKPGPSGIGLVAPDAARAAAGTGARPLWVSQPAEARVTPRVPASPLSAVPIISSAREVARPGRARLWIARSSRGGVCVLSFRPELALDPSRYHAISAACASADGLARGAAQIERAPGRGWLLSGVAPREIGAVTLRLAGGGERTVRVTDNSYSASVERPVEGLVFVSGGVRQRQINSGGAR
jgi:hypothetical protein